VTGSKVAARLVLPADNSAPSFDPLPVNGDIRKRVTHAMTLVVQGGTAASGVMTDAYRRGVADAAAANQAFGLFSKTGTPQIDKPVYSNTTLAINTLIAAGRLRLVAGKIALFAHDGGSVVARLDITRRQASQAAALRALASDVDALAAIRDKIGKPASGRLLRGLIARIGWDNGSPSLNNRYQIDSRTGALIASIAPDELNSVFGKVYVFVIGYYPARAPRQQPSGLVDDATIAPNRAFAVAINIQRKEKTREHTAALLGAMLMQDILGPRLRRESSP
jgi:hypothetical protein